MVSFNYIIIKRAGTDHHSQGWTGPSLVPTSLPKSGRFGLVVVVVCCPCKEQTCGVDSRRTIQRGLFSMTTTFLVGRGIYCSLCTKPRFLLGVRLRLTWLTRRLLNSPTPTIAITVVPRVSLNQVAHSAAFTFEPRGSSHISAEKRRPKKASGCGPESRGRLSLHAPLTTS